MTATIDASGDSGELRQRHTSQNVEAGAGDNIPHPEHEHEQDNLAAETKLRKTFGRTPDGTVFTVPQTHDMVSQLLDPRQPKNLSDAIVLAILAAHILTLYFLPASLKKPAFASIFLFWRAAYNIGIGWLLRSQSNDNKLVAWAQKWKLFEDPASGKNPRPWLYELLKRELEAKIPQDYQLEKAPLEYNAWLVFRRLVDLILMCDFVSYCLYAIACSHTPAGEALVVTVARWTVGLLLVGFNLWVKLDAHRVVKDYAWYWGDFFYLIDQELTFDGVFEMAPHPMYSIGYAGYYGISMVSASYSVLFISIVAHAAQFAFLVLVENPHIEKIYNPPAPRKRGESHGHSDTPTAESGVTDEPLVPSQRGSPTQVHKLLGIKNFDLFRSTDYSGLLLVLYLFVLTIVTPQTPLYQLLFAMHSLAWRLWHVVGVSLIALQIWTSMSIYDSLGEFGWFFGDFFFDEGAKLTYKSIYRFLNNPERIIGTAGLWGAALITWSKSIFLLALTSHLLTLAFLRFVEQPHMQKIYGRRMRDEAGLTKFIKRSLPPRVREWSSSVNEVMDETSHFVEEFMDTARPKLAAGVSTIVRDTTALLNKYPVRLTLTRLSPDLPSFDPKNYSVTVEGEVSTHSPFTERASGKEGTTARFQNELKTMILEYGAPIRVKWTAPANHGKKDWVGLYMVADNSSRDITEVSSLGRWVPTVPGQFESITADKGILVSDELLAKSDPSDPDRVRGEMVFSGDKLWWTRGVFEFRYHHDGSHNVMAISQPFEIHIGRFDDEDLVVDNQGLYEKSVETALLPVVQNCLDRDPDIAPSTPEESFGNIVERDSKYAKRLVYAIRLMFGIEFAPAVVPADGNVRNLAWRICNAKKVLSSSPAPRPSERLGGRKGGDNRGPRDGGSRTSYRSYSEVAKQNERLERFYNTLLPFDDAERAEFWAALKRELPNSFRFCGSKGHALAVRRLLETRYAPEIVKIERYDGEPVQAPQPVPWYPDHLAYSMNTPKHVIRKFPPFAAFQKFLVSETSVGNISRQEVVSMIPPLVLDVEPGMKVLDLCAAPGSKAAQLLELIHVGEEARIRKVRQSLGESKPEQVEEEVDLSIDAGDDGRATGLLIANDADYKRSHMLTHQLKRFSSPNLLVTNHDATLYPALRLPQNPDEPNKGQYLKFDRILADVPCTGDGTLRKNVNLWKDWQPGSALGLHVTQVRILVRALQMLKPGGRVVYSTCSMNPVENEAVVVSAIERCGGPSKVEIIDCSDRLPSLKRSPGMHQWQVMDKSSRIWNSWEEVQQHVLTAGDGIVPSKLTDAMFPRPDSNECSSLPLDRCMRVYAHQQDTGGFFITVLEKKADFKAKPEQPAKSEVSNGAKTDPVEAAEEKVVEEVKAVLGEPTDEIPTTGAKRSLEDGQAEPAPEVKKLKVEAAVAVEPPAPEPTTEPAERQAETEAEAETTPMDTPVDTPKDTPKDTAKADRRVRGPDGSHEEPFKYMSPDHEILNNIQAFYKISPRFPSDRFMVRNATGEPAKAIYYTSALLKDILTENEGRGVKFVHGGVKMFMKQDAPSAEVCRWRIQSEGMPIISGYVGPERVIRLTQKETFRKLLKEMFPKFINDDWKKLGEIGERARDIGMGCCLLSVEPDGSDPDFSERMVLPLWKSFHSLNLMLPKEDRSAMLLRIFNDTSPVVNQSLKESAKKEAEAEANSSQVKDGEEKEQATEAEDAAAKAGDEAEDKVMADSTDANAEATPAATAEVGEAAAVNGGHVASAEKDTAGS
ncbi:hypothetical protein DL764_008574 [Monosporascus ibericus]|uniref:Phosphatidylethanolamine N-methyltransferase n=1 Tax=Monosporascus ibericus TaxID=155417 RepID=A0A4Q4SX58_9PEZI|nr:hypothetical protein DL764_008574 [Monosporascus ibericus]